MNVIQNELPKNITTFFKKLETYLDTELFFYGSVTRSDYVPGKSDIDVAIFTDNEHSIMGKLQHFLHVKRDAFDKVVWKLNGTMIYGYKIKIDDINAEIAIYNDDFKTILIDEFNKPLKHKTIITTALLYLLKLLYYQIPLLPTQTYVNWKRFVLNELICKKESVFFLLKQT